MPTNQIKWSSCKHEFKRDGILRDIYIQQTTLHDWERFYRFLSHRRFPLDYRRSDELTTPMPATAAEIFQDTRCVHTVSFDIGGVFLNCHFFCVQQIELSFDPEYVESQARLDAVLYFMKEVGRLLRKEVLLTPENLTEAPIFRYSPENDAIKKI